MNVKRNHFQGLPPPCVKFKGKKYLWHKWTHAYLGNCIRSCLQACFEECHRWIISVGGSARVFSFAVSLCGEGNSLVIAMTTKASRQPSNISDDRRCVGEYQPRPACQFIILLHFPPKQGSLHIKVARDIKCGRLISGGAGMRAAGKPLMFLGPLVLPSVLTKPPVRGDVWARSGSVRREVVKLLLLPWVKRKRLKREKCFVSQPQICFTLVQHRRPAIPEVYAEKGRCVSFFFLSFFPHWGSDAIFLAATLLLACFLIRLYISKKKEHFLCTKSLTHIKKHSQQVHI